LAGSKRWDLGLAVEDGEFLRREVSVFILKSSNRVPLSGLLQEALGELLNEYIRRVQG